MRVVIGANSMSGRLTGIGYYTKNLIESLARREEIEDLRIIRHGLLSEKIDSYLSSSGVNDTPDLVNQRPTGDNLFGRLRPIAAKSRILVEIYDLINSLSSGRSLRKYGLNDIFHASDFQYARFPGRKIVTVHDLSTIKYPQYHPPSRVAYVNRHIQRAIDHADHIVTVSDFIKREMNELLGVPEERITTIYLGADQGFSPVSQEDFIDRSISSLEYKQYFIFVSTVEPRKNLARLLEVYRSYLDIEGDSALPLVVVGLPGWNSSAIHRELSKLNHSNRVNYLGYVEIHQLQLLLAGARALLFPSLYEGFGLPALEAMKSGTAVLTSRDSAMSEICRGAALHVSPYDDDEILAAVIQLQQNGNLVDSLVARGLAIAAEYSWDKCALETVALYRRVADGGRA
jgi:alpha-1,3-rhamnosyl/mannosyltransferase